MSAIYTPEQRATAIETVIAGLRKGTPLTVLCLPDGMPCDDTVRAWAASDEQLARAIACAREAGFDQIAMDALAIADDTANDTAKGANGDPIANSEWITRSRLRVETRLKLLAKWDPKRYGEASLLKLADADGEKLDLGSALAERRQRVAEGRDGNGA